MTSYENIFRWSLFAGACYFIGVAVAHMTGYKVPAFFIYFNVPSYDYQDKIISFLAFGWSVFLFIAGTHPSKHSTLVTGIVYSGAVAIVGLSIVNLTTDFESLAPGVNTAIFWIETGLLFCYLLLLWFLRARLRRVHQQVRAERREL